MKTKKEIEEKLKIYEEIHKNSAVFSSEFTLASGAITALKWVLEDSDVGIEYDIKSDIIAQEEKNKIKRSECPYGGIDCAWCGEDCE